MRKTVLKVFFLAALVLAAAAGCKNAEQVDPAPEGGGAAITASIDGTTVTLPISYEDCAALTGYALSPEDAARTVSPETSEDFLLTNAAGNELPVRLYNPQKGQESPMAAMVVGIKARYDADGQAEIISECGVMPGDSPEKVLSAFEETPVMDKTMDGTSIRDMDYVIPVGDRTEQYHFQFIDERLVYAYMGVFMEPFTPVDQPS